ncbi:MAG TPA: hypothetical protein VMT62_04780 [Syntrophorhabdaceae bacterium]|nr:hypothetical protein [Syntrophorhabdaceae bacterium]
MTASEYLRRNLSFFSFGRAEMTSIVLGIDLRLRNPVSNSKINHTIAILNQKGM